MITSAPSSEKWDEHQWPMIWFVVQSRTRSPSSDSGLSALNCCRTADSIHREYAFFLSSTPAYTSSVVGGGIAGHGRILIVGLFFSVRHFSAILPLLQNFTCHRQCLHCRFYTFPFGPSVPLIPVHPPFPISRTGESFCPAPLANREILSKFRFFRRNVRRPFRNYVLFISSPLRACQADFSYKTFLGRFRIMWLPTVP